MKLYNTLSRKKEEFKPIEEGKVKMYVCGPTVYNFIHIGNARPFIIFDTLRRYLEYRGYDVTFVQNFTDVDDKIIKRSHEENITPEEVATKYIKEYFVDADGLGIKRASVHPQVTDNIEQIIAFVKELEDKGYAYAVNGDVYFDTKKFKDYGKLSGIKQEELEAGARIEVNDQKRHPMDFVLWKAKKEGEPGWASPWGEGRPGWHIECSVMSNRYLGETIDIHAGGQDLKFPHHENEIAQSKGKCGKIPANYWLHGEYLLINGGKMSKSLGNVYLVKDIKEKGYDPLVYKLFSYSCHYRNKLNFTWEGIDSASKSLERLRNSYQTNLNGTDELSDEDRTKLSQIEENFHKAINDDLNMPLAMSFVWEAARFEKKNPEVAKLLSKFDTVLGIKIDEINSKKEEIPQEILDLAEQRKIARENKDWAKSDELRDLINEKGYEVKDTKNGQEIYGK